ncbi:MAG: hypothetical protein AAF065_15395 [Verrucomicrobiota bacterium]
MNQEIITALFGLGGVAIGGLATFASTYTLSKIQKKDESTALSSAIVTEVKVTLELIEAREYVENIRQIVETMEENEGMTYSFQVIVPDDYCIVYKSNADKIGLLPNTIRDKVVKFYQFLDGIICDVQPGGLIANN